MRSTPIRTRTPSPEAPLLVTTPVHRFSRRLLGLSPEFPPVAPPTSMAVPTPSATLPSSQTAPSISQVTLEQPHVPATFHGDAFEDVEDWLDQYERVADVNHWTERQKLTHAYFALEKSARTWYENREASFHTWGNFRRQLLDSFASSDRRDYAQQLIEARVQQPNESVVMYAEDMARLFRRADPDMTEAKKVRHLMRGIKEPLFAGLVRNPPTTVDDFIKEATIIERALQQRCRHFDRLPNNTPISAAAQGVDQPSLREMIRVILREELRALGITPTESPVVSVAEVVRQELRQAFSSPPPCPEARPLSYADVVRRPPPSPEVPPFQPRTVPVPWWQRESVRRPPVRRTDLWRTADRRPLCFHCGEPGHIARFCPHREAGVASFSPAASLRFDDRCAPNRDHLSTSQAASPRRRLQSPSPVRYTSPNRQSFADVVRGGRSPSPRRGN